MLKLAVTIAAGAVLFSSAQALADDFDWHYMYIGPWHSNDLPHQESRDASLTNQRPVTQSPPPGELEFSALATEADLLCEDQPFNVAKWKSGRSRAAMLGSFLRSHHLVGMTSVQLHELLGQPLYSRDIEPNTADLFFVGVATEPGQYLRALSNEPVQKLEEGPFLCLEVRSREERVYGYRLVLQRGRETSAKSAIARLANEEFRPDKKDLKGHEASEQTLRDWKRYVEQKIEFASQLNDAEQKVSKGNQQTRVHFEVSRDGLISNLSISVSSKDSRLDKLVLETIQAFNGSRLLHIPACVEDSLAMFDKTIGFYVYCNGSSVEHFLHGHCDKLNGVDMIQPELKSRNSPAADEFIPVDKPGTPLPPHQVAP